MTRKTTGRYFKSLRKFIKAGGSERMLGPNIHISGSVSGMRKLYWGYDCDVVRVGEWIYKVNWRACR